MKNLERSKMHKLLKLYSEIIANLASKVYILSQIVIQW